MLGFVFGFAVGGFVVYHLWLACNNKTTIESMERAPAIALDDEGDGAMGKAKLRDYYELNKVERRRMDKVSTVAPLSWRGFGGGDRADTFLPLAGCVGQPRLRPWLEAQLGRDFRRVGQAMGVAVAYRMAVSAHPHSRLTGPAGAGRC